jgi:hypothetical protein
MRCFALIVARTEESGAAPELKFKAYVDFLKLPPDLYLGEVSGVAVNSKGHIFVFNRGNTTGPAYAAAAAQLLEFASDGKFIREIGTTFTLGATPTRWKSTNRTTFGLPIKAPTW